MKSQFQILYRIFLFRVIDPDLISPGADISHLLGQLAVFPVLLGVGFTMAAAGWGGSGVPRSEMLIEAWGAEHTLIATTMLIAGIFAVLSWESIFPDLRDVLVLGPLPLPTRTIFLAKIASLGAALSVSVIALNALPGITWAIGLAPPSQSLIDLILMPALYRTFFAQWVTVLASGAFIFSSVIAIQGIAALLLPRQRFLQIAAFLQMISFCLFLSTYFLQPSLVTPSALSADANQQILRCLPSYWFLGLFQLLNGSMHPVMNPLATRAVIGLMITVSVAAITYVLSYRSRLRKIAETPEIVPRLNSRRQHRKFGCSLNKTSGYSLNNAICGFTWRTLTRSRQHRITLAFYLGIGLSIVIFMMRSGVGKGHFSRQEDARPLFASFVIFTVWIVGMRVVFSLPLALRSNWIFRVSQVQPTVRYFAAARRPLFLLAIAPGVAVAAPVFLLLWHWQRALGHVLVLSLWGIIVGYASLRGFHKLPFTCSYQPGKSVVHMRILAAIGIVFLLGKGADFEREALQAPVKFIQMVSVLALSLMAIRHSVMAADDKEDVIVQYDDAPTSSLQILGLYRDGVILQ